MGRRVLAAVAACLTFAACGNTPAVLEPAAASPAAVSQPAAASQSASAAARSPSAKPAEAAPCTVRTLAFKGADTDLTGAWLGNDEGVYYLRQLGKDLWWSGMSGQSGPAPSLGRDWNNVAHGTIGNDLTIKLDWADVPRGEVMGDGTLTWVIEEKDGNTRLRKTAETGTGFGGALFTPCGPG